MAQMIPCTPRSTLRFHPCLFPIHHSRRKSKRTITCNFSSSSSSSSSAAADSSTSYLDMWKKAMERERNIQVLHTIQPEEEGYGDLDENMLLQKKTEMFEKIISVPKEERDRVQRLQVIDRAAAAISAARALIKQPPPTPSHAPNPVAARLDVDDYLRLEIVEKEEDSVGVSDDGETFSGSENGNAVQSELEALKLATPGPDFWSWSPPEDSIITDIDSLQPKKKSNAVPEPSFLLMEKETSPETLSIPFESTLSQSEHTLLLPPLQSIVELEKIDTPSLSSKQLDLNEVFSSHAEEAAIALSTSDEASSGVKPDGTKWWKETGIETRPDGVVFKWTLTRGVSADGAVEWEDKYWEASDQLEYKELGSEKSGRDVAGNVWREYWKESMWQDQESGLLHMEKTADKWGKNTRGSEWHEKWWEHYDESGQAEKWADKWCSIDPKTPLDAGHAHVWHERWGEKYDGQGGSVKYTDKWAERSEDDGWSKWGDKWDENFNLYGHGVKQGETWWQGKYGDQWNRTWGEQHNGTGWIHKYGKSSSGEHWDTHVPEDTWYERYPHFGFDHCFRNSVQLRQVRKPQPPLPPPTET